MFTQENLALRSGHPYTAGMDEEAAFRDRWQRRIDVCGPYCSCLLILLIVLFAFIGLVLR